jgi:hypothetical protein
VNLGRPVAEVIISSAKRSGWDWLLHPQPTTLLLNQKHCYQVTKLLIVPEILTVNAAVDDPAISLMSATAACNSFSRLF